MKPPTIEDVPKNLSREGCIYEYAVNVFDLTRFTALTSPVSSLIRLISSEVRPSLPHVPSNLLFECGKAVKEEMGGTLEDQAILLTPESDFQMGCIRVLLRDYLRPRSGIPPIRLYQRIRDTRFRENEMARMLNQQYPDDPERAIDIVPGEWVAIHRFPREGEEEDGFFDDIEPIE